MKNLLHNKEGTSLLSAGIPRLKLSSTLFVSLWSLVKIYIATHKGDGDPLAMGNKWDTLSCGFVWFK